MNAIVVEEKRSFIDKIRDWYQTKVVDTGVSAKVDQAIDDRGKIARWTIGVLGATATVILTLVPADGPVGEICTALATPALIALVDVASKIQANLVHGTKNFGEGVLLKVDTSGNGKSYNLNDPKEPVEDVTKLGQAVRNLSQEQ